MTAHLGVGTAVLVAIVTFKAAIVPLLMALRTYGGTTVDQVIRVALVITVVLAVVAVLWRRWSNEAPARRWPQRAWRGVATLASILTASGAVVWLMGGAAPNPVAERLFE